MKGYLVTVIDETNIDKEIKTIAYKNENEARAFFDRIQGIMQQDDDYGSFFLDESVDGKYDGYIASYKNSSGLVVLTSITLYEEI